MLWVLRLFSCTLQFSFCVSIFVLCLESRRYTQTLWTCQLYQRNANKVTRETGMPAVCHSWDPAAFLFNGDKTRFKNKFHIIVNLRDVLSAKEGITGVLWELDALPLLVCCFTVKLCTLPKTVVQMLKHKNWLFSWGLHVRFMIQG